MNKIELGEPLYEYTLSITGLTEYGVSFEDLVSGKIPPPPEGARFDVAFAGEASGSKLSGKVTGVDYLHRRAASTRYSFRNYYSAVKAGSK